MSLCYFLCREVILLFMLVYLYRILSAIIGLLAPPLVYFTCCHLDITHLVDFPSKFVSTLILVHSSAFRYICDNHDPSLINRLVCLWSFVHISTYIGPVVLITFSSQEACLSFLTPFSFFGGARSWLITLVQRLRLSTVLWHMDLPRKFVFTIFF